MAANPTLVQSINAASNAAGPTTITPTFGGGSVAGNLLLLVVAVAGTTVSITTPANWTLVATQTIAGVGQIALFSFANNTGGITAVAVTVTATAGSAVASMFEFSGIPATATADFSNAFAINTGTQRITSFPPPPFASELLFISAAFNATTTLLASAPFSTGNASWSANTAGGTSASGSPNLTIANWWGLSPGPGGEQDIVRLTATVLLMAVAVRYQTNANGPLFGAGQGPEGNLGLSNSPNEFGAWSIG